MKRKKGLTLVEVIASFLIVSLLSFMVVMVLGAMNLQLMRERSRTTNAFTEQGKLEEKVAEVENLVKVKVEQEDIINNNSSTELEKNKAKNKKAKIEQELNTYNPFTQIVNNQTLTIYPVSVKRFNSENVEVGNLVSWVIDKKALSFPMPKIGKFIIEASGGIDKGFYGIDNIGKQMTSTVTYGENKNKLFTEQFTWYTSRPGFHMIFPQDDDFKPEEGYIGSRYPSFSGDYQYITEAGSSTPSETEKNLSKITEDMKGHFIVCGLRPTIREGKIGEENSSNTFYLVNYPFGSNRYAGAIDASLISEFPSNRELSNIKGIYEKMEFNSISSKIVPKIEIHGDKTGEVNYKGKSFDTYSRYFRFTGDSSYGVKIKEKLPLYYTVYMVGRQNANIATSGAISGSGELLGTSNLNIGKFKFTLGFDEFNLKEEPKVGSEKIYSDTTIGGNDGKWHVLALSFTPNGISIYRDAKYVNTIEVNRKYVISRQNGDIDLKLGDGIDMDLAEFIIGKDIDANSVSTMMNSLTEKYGIN